MGNFQDELRENLSTLFKLMDLSTFMLRDLSDRKIGCESVN